MAMERLVFNILNCKGTVNVISSDYVYGVGFSTNKTSGFIIQNSSEYIRNWRNWIYNKLRRVSVEQIILATKIAKKKFVIKRTVHTISNDHPFNK